MAVSIAAMTVAELQAWMALHPVYVTVAEAVQAGALVATPASGVGGVAITTAEAAAAVADATVTGSTILDFAEAAELLSAGTKVKTAGTGLLHGSTGYKLSAVLGVDVGIIGAAVAPVLGVALGVNLYESNPELWTKLSQRLLPFCYPGTTKIPTWAEVGETAWRTSVLKRVVDAIKELFEEEEIPMPAINPPDTGTATIDGATYDYCALPGVSYIDAGNRLCTIISVDNPVETFVCTDADGGPVITTKPAVSRLYYTETVDGVTRQTWFN